MARGYLCFPLLALGQEVYPGGVQEEEMAVREKIKLVSEAKTGYFYTTTKNKRSTPDKLRFKKYDPVVRKHVWFKEAKIK